MLVLERLPLPIVSVGSVPSAAQRRPSDPSPPSAPPPAADFLNSLSLSFVQTKRILLGFPYLGVHAVVHVLHPQYGGPLRDEVGQVLRAPVDALVGQLRQPQPLGGKLLVQIEKVQRRRRRLPKRGFKETGGSGAREAPEGVGGGQGGSVEAIVNPRCIRNTTREGGRSACSAGAGLCWGFHE